MKTAIHFLSGDERRQIEKAVQAAEKRTSAEIICSVATESGRYDRAESLAGLLFALIGIGVAHAASHGFVIAPDSWSAHDGVPPFWQALAVVAGFVVGTIAASYFYPLRSLFTSRVEMEEEVWQAARREFLDARVNETMQRSGVLIYLSLYERKAVVLADQKALAVLGSDGLNQVRDLVLARLAEGKRVEAFMEPIALLADKLAPTRPADAAFNPDERPNAMRIHHPRPM